MKRALGTAIKKIAQEKIKSELIANITHEFRTPLAIMRGSIYLATKDIAHKNNKKHRAAKKALRAIDEEIENLSEMLSDLVLITSGDVHRTIELVPINIHQIANRAADKLKNLAKKKSIRIYKKGGLKNDFVVGDKKYLERVFLNLIRNAITYGGKKIEVSLETKKNNVLVHIKDDGTGISKDDLPHIFERFFRADKSHNHDDGHSGLGLPIAKWIIDTHKGSINVKSSLRKGSTFTVTLPLKRD